MSGAELKYVTANGLRFAYLEEGTGPLVLLFHGFPDTAHSWDHVRPRLAAAGFRAVSPFMRGYAPTEIPEKDADQDTLSRDATGLIQALGEERAIVVGHDWGAAVAYGAAALEPERVAKLVVLAIPHPATIRPTPRLAWGVRHFVAYKLPGAPKRFAKNDFAALPAIFKRWSPTWTPAPSELAAVRACFADPRSLDAAFGYYRALRFRPPPYLRAQINVPTVVFAGLYDPLITPQHFHDAAKMFGASYQVHAMPGGHFMHLEHPEKFSELLLSSLAP